MNYFAGILLFLLTAMPLLALRDPFTCADDRPFYEYLGFGKVQGTALKFGMIVLRGTIYYAQEGDSIDGHMVIALNEREAILKENGHEIHVPRATAMPST